MDYDQTPHFWYGSGQWGKAKCHLTIISFKDPLRSFQVYALPDPPGYVYGWSSSNMLVPILVGMDFCLKTGLILDFSDGYALRGAEPDAEPYSMRQAKP